MVDFGGKRHDTSKFDMPEGLVSLAALGAGRVVKEHGFIASGVEECGDYWKLEGGMVRGRTSRRY